MRCGIPVAVLLATHAVSADVLPIESGQFAGEPFAPEPFAFEVLAPEDAPHIDLQTITVDRHGRIDIGTLNGIAQFNGTSFRRLDDGEGTPHGAEVTTVA